MKIGPAFFEALFQAEVTKRPIYLIQCKTTIMQPSTEDIELRAGGLCDDHHYVRAIVFPPQAVPKEKKHVD